MLPAKTRTIVDENKIEYEMRLLVFRQKLTWDKEKCVNCLYCLKCCPKEAISQP